MATAVEYRKLAEECFQWARETSAESVREHYASLGRAWLECAARTEVRSGIIKSSRTETRAESRVGGSNIATQARRSQSRLQCHQCYSMAPILLSLQLHSGRFWVFDLEPMRRTARAGSLSSFFDSLSSRSFSQIAVTAVTNKMMTARARARAKVAFVFFIDLFAE